MRWQRMYIIGMAGAIVLFVTGELIWLPDPLRIGRALYWIDLLNPLMLLLLITPLLWLIASVKGVVHEYRVGGRHSVIILRRALIGAISCAAAAVLLVMVTTGELSLPSLIVLAALIGSGWLLTVWDSAASELRLRPGQLPWRSAAGLLISLALLAGLFWPTSYLVTYPGLTVNMNRYASVDGGSAKGEIMGVLVFDRPAFPADWLYAKLFPNYAFHPIENLGMSVGAYETLVRDMKEEADAMGSAVAMHAAGLGKGVTSHGAKIISVELSRPAIGLLRPGDVIVGIDGGTVASTTELQDRMRLVKPGDLVRVKLVRGRTEHIVDVPTTEHPDDKERAAFGIQVMDDLELDLPRHVSFRTYLAHEGGPSHGAALTLALLDQLTPGGVTMGNRVAVTGTIAADGTIGQIGGIRQKAYTVYRAGADAFFVPSGQEHEAKLGAPNLLVVPVNNIFDIINWLKIHPK
ncbi:PDZ domain-containing protein [Paenibacillus tarimensis]